MISETITDKGLISEYLKSIQHYSEATKEGYNVTINQFRTHCEKSNIRLLDVETKDISSFISIRKTNTTKYHYTTRLRLFYKYCITQKLLQDNPAESIKIKRSKRKAKRLLSKDDFQKILSQCQGLRETTIIHFLFYAGVRAKELRFIEINDIDLISEEKTITIRVSKTEDGKREILIAKSLLPVLEIYLKARKKLESKTDYLFLTKRGTQFNKRTIIHLVDQLQKNLDMKFSCHDFRRSAITRMYRATNDIVYCQSFAGHSTIDMTRRYILDDEQKSRMKKYKDLEY